MSENKALTKRPKVAIIHPAVGCSLGGSQIFVLELAERLKEKCDVTIFSNKKVNDLCKPVFSICRGNLVKENNFFIKLFLNFLRKFVSTPEVVIENLTSFFPVLFELLKEDYDVIYPNNDWGGLLVASVARKIKNTPILFTEHNGFMFDGLIARRNLKFKPDKYVTISNDVLEWVKSNYPDCDAEFIPNGVDLNKFKSDIKPAFVDLPRPIIIAVGRNQPNKRLDLAIEVISRLEKGSLLLLTSEENSEELKTKGEKLLGKERFKMMNVSFQEMPSYYSACDLFTLPSDLEPFGLVYIEAMACNKPVVAPKDESRAYIIGDAGILCDVTNIDDYKQAIEKALAYDFGDKPKNQAEKFSWEISADRYNKAIQSLL